MTGHVSLFEIIENKSKKDVRHLHSAVTFDNRISYEKLAALISRLTLVDSRYEHWKFVFRSTLYAQSQTADLLPGDLHHAFLGVERRLIVIRSLLKCTLVFDMFHDDPLDR